MGLGRSKLAVTQISQQQLLVLSAVTVILDEVIQKDRATVIYAEDVVVQGKVTSMGNPVTIYCRTIRFEKTGEIDTTGRDSSISFTPGIRQESPNAPGAAGIDGRDGGAGERGGDVFIATSEVIGVLAVTSDGGKGGRGEDGGHGKQGATGAAGQAISMADPQPVAPPQCNGQMGAPGGALGLPGRRGVGGTGGAIAVRLSGAAGVIAQKLSAAIGAPGEPAAPGNPGEGGDGGPPGVVSVTSCWGADMRVFSGNADDIFSDAFHGGADTSALFVNDPAALAGSTPLEEALQQAAIQRAMRARKVELYATIMIPGDPGPHHGHCSTTRTQGVPGPKNITVDLRSAEVLERQSVVPGMPLAGAVSVDTIDEESAAAAFDGPVLDLLVTATEDRYRQAGGKVDDTLRQTIEFLLSIVVNDPVPSAQKREALGRVYSMARKYALHLDFYGYSAERAPLLTFEAFRGIIDTMVIPQAQVIEQSFNAYWDAGTNAELQRVGIRQMIGGGRARTEVFKAELDRSKAAIGRQLAELPLLDSRVEIAFQVLLEKKDELDDAIRPKHAGCNLISAATAVATIVAGVASGGAGFIAAASAGAKLYKDFTANDESFSTLWSERKVLQEDLIELGKGVAGVAAAIGQIATAVDKLTPEQKKLPQFKMEREAFDKVANEFVNLPAAQAYREAGYDYLKAVETRNQAIIDYNGALVQLIDLKCQIASSVRAVDVLESALNATTDPASPVIISTMHRLYADTLALAAQMVHAEKKALNYHFARPGDAPVNALNLATIVGDHNRAVLVDWAGAKLRYEARREIAGLSLRLDKLVPANAWEAFKRTGVLSFSLRFDNPAYSALFRALSGIRLTGMELNLRGAVAPADQEYSSWSMTQMGSESIYRRNADPVYFSHHTVEFTGLVALSGARSVLKPDFSERNLYAGVSPFAAWLLVMNQDETLRLDLSALERAELVFDGYMLEN
ncbi:hypothetical protein [Massilia antarctica]|uniref:hypothetical protein n=1 Tax=Massilia antarctica TaxID=2765360 RepID=UPI0035EFBEF8